MKNMIWIAILVLLSGYGCNNSDQEATRPNIILLLTDDHETVNLIDDHPEKASELKEKLIKWTDELKYPGLEMKNSPAMRKCYDFYFNEV